MKQLIAELRDEKTSDNASLEIRAIASRDQKARRTAVPSLLEIFQQSHGRALLNAMSLAGDLKVDQAVPVLFEMLKNPMTMGGVITFYRNATLANDPPGHALARIGVAAIPSVTTLLESPDRTTRYRAALVLGNMNLPSADAVLENIS